MRAELVAAARGAPAKVREEYSAMGHTRFAAMALSTNATLMMLKSAKKRSAYGKKQRRIMNSVCRLMYRKGFDGRLSACVCQIPKSCSGRPAARRWRPHPVAKKLAIAPKTSKPPRARKVLLPELLQSPMVMPIKRKR